MANPGADPNARPGETPRGVLQDLRTVSEAMTLAATVLTRFTKMDRPPDDRDRALVERAVRDLKAAERLIHGG